MMLSYVLSPQNKTIEFQKMAQKQYTRRPLLQIEQRGGIKREKQLYA